MIEELASLEKELLEKKEVFIPHNDKGYDFTDFLRHLISKSIKTYEVLTPTGMKFVLK